MTHLKRQEMPKTWPVRRKGTAYIVRPKFGLKKGIPLLIVLRDILKVAKDRKEVKKAIYEKKILINSRSGRNEKEVLQLFDSLCLIPSKKYYRITLSEKGKFKLEEIKENDSEEKISKVINKKILKGKKIQLNLSDGRNFFSDIKCKVNDSVIVDLKNKKIKECLSLNKEAEAFIIEGKHTGKKGKIIGFSENNKMVELKMGNDKKSVLIKHIMVIK